MCYFVVSHSNNLLDVSLSSFFEEGPLLFNAWMESNVIYLGVICSLKWPLELSPCHLLLAIPLFFREKEAFSSSSLVEVPTQTFFKHTSLAVWERRVESFQARLLLLLLPVCKKKVKSRSSLISKVAWGLKAPFFSKAKFKLGFSAVCGKPLWSRNLVNKV